MNRRDLFKRMGLVIAGSVPIGALLEQERDPFAWTKVWAEITPDGVEFKSKKVYPYKYGPYNTDDAKYDEILDEMLGEEWS